MNPLMIKNILTPLIGIAAAWLSRKLPFIDAATFSMWIDGAITAIVTGVLAYFNRGSAVISAAADNPEVQKVVLAPNASQATVEATPSNVTKAP